MRTRAVVLAAVALAALAACGPTCGAHINSSQSSTGATNGTFSEDITVTGFFSGHVTSAYASCVKPSGGFQGFVQDSKAGSPLRFDFNIVASAYHGPGTYGPSVGNTVLGTVYMAGQITWISKSGSFTVNPGEKSGSIHMHLEAGPTEKPEDISGSWRCG